VNAPNLTDCGAPAWVAGGAVETYPAGLSRLLSQAVAASALLIIPWAIRC